MAVMKRTFKRFNGSDVVIYIESPVQEDGKGDWICKYRIDGIGDSSERNAIGVDGIQAMILALTYISTSLYYSHDYTQGRLTWLGGMSAGDLGLPVAEGVRDEISIRIDKVGELIQRRS